ncbi:MAG: PIN domain-containing protein [Planctomycetes bacterium]|nr:PIN domain-containing protein [Planctomycetota bacterium]MBI3762840.1 PIN domain-containing protein [Chloroflexota bacterium]
MGTRLLDTNIVSYLFKGHSLAAAYRPHLAGHTMAVCFMTEAELFEGALRARWGSRRWARLEALLSTFLYIPSSPDLSRGWAQVRTERQTQPIGAADAWIAAAALVHGCELVTHNPSDFQGIAGLTVISAAP